MPTAALAVPELTAAEYRALALDIAKHGLPLKRMTGGGNIPGVGAVHTRTVLCAERGEWRVESDRFSVCLHVLRNGKTVANIDRWKGSLIEAALQDLHGVVPFGCR